MRRYRGGRVIVVAVVGLCAAAVAGTFIESGSGSAGASSRVRLLVQLNGPPPAQQHGGLTGSPGGPSVPGGPAGPAPALRGTFVLTGAVRDRGRAVLRLPTLGSDSLESTLPVGGARGALRVGMSGGGRATSGQGNGRWRVVGGSGAYAGASGGGSVTQTPERAVLVGRLTLRAR